MKKVLRIVLLALLISSVSKQSIACNDCCCCEESIEENYVLQLLSSVEDSTKTTPKLEQDFFEELIKELSDDNASYDLLQNYWQNKNQDRSIKVAVKIIQNNQKVLQKYLQTFPTLELRNNLNQEAKTVAAKILDRLLNDQAIGKQISKIVSQNLISVNSEFAKKVLAKYPNITNDFLTKSPNLKKTPYWLIKNIFNNTTGKTKIKLAIMLKKVKVKGGLFRNFVKQKASYFALKKFPEAFPKQAKASTQSEHHLKLHRKAVKQTFVANLTKDKSVRNMFKRLHDKEKKEQEKGRYTFFHAQQWQFHFFQDVFQNLWEIKYGEKIEDYHFLRFEPKKSYNTKKEIKKRKAAMNGTDGYGWGKNRKREKTKVADRLFLNHAIFGNSQNFGESSASYWLHNHCHGNFGIDIRWIFSQLELKYIYKKYAEKLKALESLHQELTTYGNMLLISLSEEQLKNAVFLTNTQGLKIEAEVNGKKTGDIKTIMDTLKSNPSKVQASGTFCWGSTEDSDSLQYCLVLTGDLALDPHNGPRIYSFNAPDKKKFAEYEKMRDKIFAEIAQDMATGELKKNIS